MLTLMILMGGRAGPWRARIEAGRTAAAPAAPVPHPRCPGIVEMRQGRRLQPWVRGSSPTRTSPRQRAAPGSSRGGRRNRRSSVVPVDRASRASPGRRLPRLSTNRDDRGRAGRVSGLWRMLPRSGSFACRRRSPSTHPHATILAGSEQRRRLSRGQSLLSGKYFDVSNTRARLLFGTRDFLRRIWRCSRGCRRRRRRRRGDRGRE